VHVLELINQRINAAACNGKSEVLASLIELKSAIDVSKSAPSVRPEPSRLDGDPAWIGPTHYTPELWTIRKDYIYAAQAALVNAIEYIKECQATHEANLGETTLKNRLWANRMRDDLLKAEQALDNIQRPEGAQP
jgi:hypothetical protein